MIPCSAMSVAQRSNVNALSRGSSVIAESWTEVNCEVTALLVPEPSNPHDSNAVMVTVSGRHVGYLSRSDAKSYADVIALAYELGAHPGCRALICGRDEGSETRNLGIFLDLAPPQEALTDL